MTSRRAFLTRALAALAFGAAVPLLSAPVPPVVLFVCDFGTAKSAIARELFRRRARERGIAVTAFSRGLQIADHISPPLRQQLDAAHIDSRRDGFAVLTADDVRRASMVVTFARLPPGFRPPELLDWSALPSVNDAWPTARAELDRRIDVLLDRIEAEQKKSAMTHAVSFRDATRVWLRIALLSFGGPAGQIAVMHRILIDEKKWIGERRFLHALNFCMLLPGPEAQQLATYIGWLLHGVRGGLVAGALFVLPGALAILMLSWIYVLYGNVGPVEALFFGLKAAVLAIVVQAVVRIGGRALKSTASRLLAATAFVAIFLLAAPFPLIVAIAGLVGWIAGRRGSLAFSGGGHGGAGVGLADADSALGDGPVLHPASRTRNAALILAALWLLPVGALALLAPHSVWSDIASFFSRMAVVTFGGAYAVLAYVAQQGVAHYHWLTAREMLDGLGLAETTPGPLIMVTQFVGFLGAFRASTGLPPLLAGSLGALLTTWVTFLPCFVWIFAGAPFIERLRGNAALASALGAITATVVGVILNLAIWFALHFLFTQVETVRAGPLGIDAPVPASLDPLAAGLSLLAIVWLFVLKRSVFETLAVTAAGGLLLKLVLA